MSERVPEGWKIRRFSDIASNRTTRFIPESRMTETLYLGLEHLNPETRFIKKFGISSEIISTKTKFLKGDTLFGKLRPYLHKVAFPDCGGICSTDILAITTNKTTDPVFLYYICTSDKFIANAVESSAGNIMPRASWKDLAAFPVMTPPLPEQMKIASVLTSVDEVIKCTRAQINKLQDLKKALLQDLLTKGIGHTKFKDSELGQIPKNWEIKKLKDIGRFSKGKGISKKETSTRGVPCLRYAEIYTDHDVVIKKLKSFIPQEIVNSSKRLRKNDLVFAGSGETVQDIGKSIAFISDSEAYVGGDSIVLSPDSEVNIVFMAYQLNDDVRRVQLRKLGQGSSIIHIYASGLKEVDVFLPPPPEQKKIASILTSVDEMIENTQAQINKFRSLKKALMKDLLTGKVRVTS